MFCGNLRDSCETQGNNKVIAFLIEVLLDLVGHHHEYVGGLIHKLRQTKISDSLLCKIRRSDKLNAFNLTEMCRVTQQVEEK